MWAPTRCYAESHEGTEHLLRLLAWHGIWMWLAFFRWNLGTACLHVFSMWLAYLGAWARQGTSCLRQYTAQEAFDRRQTVESWTCKQCAQDSLAEATFVCHACGKTKPEKDAFNKVSVKRRYCTQCSQGEYRGFHRCITKGCGRWPMNDFSDHLAERMRNNPNAFKNHLKCNECFSKKHKPTEEK